MDHCNTFIVLFGSFCKYKKKKDKGAKKLRSKVILMMDVIPPFKDRFNGWIINKIMSQYHVNTYDNISQFIYFGNRTFIICINVISKSLYYIII